MKALTGWVSPTLAELQLFFPACRFISRIYFHGSQISSPGHAGPISAVSRPQEALLPAISPTGWRDGTLSPVKKIQKKLKFPPVDPNLLSLWENELYISSQPDAVKDLGKIDHKDLSSLLRAPQMMHKILLFKISTVSKASGVFFFHSSSEKRDKCFHIKICFEFAEQRPWFLMRCLQRKMARR